ncbi:MAG: right-handed parallel beta-helix repeat-containing protein [Tannerellaceae bacterium]|nr:right-handed parallel beta-helix repeat-containing protein [Tannerellaceae bacterium]
MKKYLLYVLYAVSFLLFIGCQRNESAGKNYYLDGVNGDDTQDGRTPATAWRSPEKLKGIELQAGDSVLFKRSTTFTGILEVTGNGTSGKPVVVDAYGGGAKSCISAPDHSLYTVLVKNSSYLTLQNLDVVNQGSESMPWRCGVKVSADNYGVSRNITLNALNIHDVNGSRVKQEGGGSGILIENKGEQILSSFDNLIIENCVIRRCERNAIIWSSAYWSRDKWNPSTNTIVRRNLIEEVPGDGIVPIGCVNAVIEYNLMRNCPATLPDTEAAAGFWPWSCDNTILQFNEVSDHKAPWDAQGFDSDYNCTNTTIRYNYSHDNEGGFVLICNSGSTDPAMSIGNEGTVVCYNISINDATRLQETPSGYISPTIYILGPSKNTLVNNNILHVNRKPEAWVDRSIITADSWDGYADQTTFKDNLFYVAQPTEVRLYESTNNLFTGNYYLGRFTGVPEDKEARRRSAVYRDILNQDPEGFNSLASLMNKVTIADGETEMVTVNKEAIHAFFEKLDE